MTKSKVLFSDNTEEEEAMTCLNVLGITRTDSLGTYLGFPLEDGRKATRNFNIILERTRKKLVGWKRNLLSTVCRTILIKSVNESLPSYIMQLEKLPTKLCGQLEKINRDFL